MKILEKINKVVEQKNKEITKILDPKKKYRIDFFKTGKNKMLGIFDGKKMVVGGEYNFYGIYQPYTKLWIWASSIPGVDTTHIKNIKKLKSSDHLFESTTDPKLNFYYQLLTQDVLYIIDDQMLDWINELILYLTGDLFYFNPVNSDENIQFLTLVKIKEKYL
jgi:hypothetical protein